MIVSEASVFEQVAAIIRGLLERPAMVLMPESVLGDIEDFDSLRLMETVALAEQHFGVEVETAALDDLGTIADIVAAIRRAMPAEAR